MIDYNIIILNLLIKVKRERNIYRRPAHALKRRLAKRLRLPAQALKRRFSSSCSSELSIIEPSS